MAKLKLGQVADDKPVRLTIELPAHVNRDLVAYAAALGQEYPDLPPTEPAKLIAAMLSRFMATDRAFNAIRRKPAAIPDQR